MGKIYFKKMAIIWSRNGVCVCLCVEYTALLKFHTTMVLRNLMTNFLFTVCRKGTDPKPNQMTCSAETDKSE